MHYYLYLSRPPGIGCQPDGFDIDTREVWLPAREVDGRNYLGRCGWPRQLLPEDIYHYSLRPESELERAELVFWNRDKGEVETWLKEDYMSQPDDLLEEYATEHRDMKAWAALVLKRAAKEAMA